MKDNVLLHYTGLKAACGIFPSHKIKMSFLKDSKDPLEAVIAWSSYKKLYSSEPPASYTKNVQISCFAKASFPICGDNRREKDHSTSICHYTDRRNFPDTSVLSQAMFYNYGNLGGGVCFILDREQFEKENDLRGVDIKYVSGAYCEYVAAWLRYMDKPTNKNKYDMLSFKHESFAYEKELRFFKEGETQQSLCIGNSYLGLCLGPRLTFQYLIKDTKEIKCNMRYVIKSKNSYLGLILITGLLNTIIIILII
jgi:hypothetical protein